MNPYATSMTPRSRGASALLAAALVAPLGLAALSASPAAAGTGTAAATRVVVTSVAGTFDGAARAAAAVRAAGGRVLDTLPLIGGVSASLPAGTVLAPSYRVISDRTLTVSGNKDAESGADAQRGVRELLGLGASRGDGAGVTVAVVDTGVADVPDLQGRVTHVDTGVGSGDAFGHGTFVAGLIAGSGKASGGEYAGIAPNARILDVKVADGSGSTSLVAVLKGLQAVAAARPAVDVVNLSLSSGSLLPYQIDPLTVALEALWRTGITVVVPAGNNGDSGPGSVDSPGTDPILLTVGGLDANATPAHGDDTVPSWSGRGPTPQGVQKPDLVAPGTHVVSLAVPGSVIYDEHESARVDGGYFKGSGSSFSTAVTSGAAAAVLSKRPRLSPDQIKAVLMGSAYALANPDGSGSGGLDLAAAYDATPTDVQSSSATPIPGDPAVWQAYIDAVLAGDADAAASSWSQLSEAARNWAASSWSQLSAQMQEWAARNWAASSWSLAFPDARNWAARNWAAMNWAAQNWAASSWSASSWSAMNWAAMNWAAQNWAASNWAAQNWAAANWAAMNWAASNWAASNWAASNWAASNWAASNWAASNWAAANWSALTWS